MYNKAPDKRIIESKLKKKNFKAKYEEIYIAIKKEKDKRQVLYDKDTTSPRNEFKQKEWEENIAKELVSLDAYSNPVIEVKIK